VNARTWLALLVWVAAGCESHERSHNRGAAAEHTQHGGEPQAGDAKATASAKPPSGEHDQHASAQPTGAHDGRPADVEPGQIAPGHASVLLDPGRLQSLGVRTDRVARRSFTRDIRATGIVRIDERLQSHIHVKFMGFVERVFVNFVGRKVRKGEPLLSVYSPDLLAAESELAQAFAARDKPRSGPFAESDRAQTEALIKAARARLTLLDIDRAELDRLERTLEPRRALTITSPLTGTVVERNVVDGMRVMPDTPLMVVADLRNVWVMADIFEHDLAAIQVGDHAVISFAGSAAAERDGRVGFVSPTLDDGTRTAKVRIEVRNDDGAVRPGLFANVTIHVAVGERLAVPASAVIATGVREIAFVQVGPGRFEPRVVSTGTRAGDFMEVLAGLSEGDIVAVSAQFLLDSESQIRGGSSKSTHSGH
jgi:membrane fusion protein, copper/silver efflux system